MPPGRDANIPNPIEDAERDKQEEKRIEVGLQSAQKPIFEELAFNIKSSVIQNTYQHHRA